MKQVICILGLFCLYLLPVQGQRDVTKKEKEDLITLLETLADDGLEKAAVWNELAYRYREVSEDTARLYATRGKELAARKKDKLEESNSWVVFGLMAKYAVQYDTAEVFFLKALALREAAQDTEKAASCYNNLGLLYRDQAGGYSKAREYFSRGLSQTGDAQVKIAGKLHNNLGDVLNRMGEYDAAVKHLETSITIREALKDPKGVALTKLNLASTLQHLGDYKRAGTLLEESLSFFKGMGGAKGQGKSHLLLGNNAFYQQNQQEALAHYETALQFEESLDSTDTAILYRNIGSAYFQQGKNEKALENYHLARKQFERLRNPRELAAIHYDIGNVYYDQSSYDTALIQYKQSLSTIEADTVKDPELKLLVLFNLSNTYRRLEGYPEALYYNLEYTQIRDSIFSRAKTALVYENQMDRERAEREKQKLVILGIAGFIILWLLLALAVLYAYNQKKKQKIAAQEVDALLQGQELELIYARQHAQDEEQKRIAEDLHDRLGGMLTTVKLYYGALDEKLSEMQEDIRQKYEKANTLLDEACNAVRAIAHNLQSGILAKFGLEAALESMVEDIKEVKRLSVELDTSGLEERLDSNLEFELFKVIQEMVSNVLKHAQATKISIQVNHFDDLVNVIVEDNGVGFDVEKARMKDGMGLKNMKARVENVGGALQIDSRKGKGTTMLIDIPLEA
ncbi:MAG: sensor histidine kinase [Lewinellaceae bacterium]|nr:sensor histidine kinase [Lewinellaceae bacterium]